MTWIEKLQVHLAVIGLKYIRWRYNVPRDEFSRLIRDTSHDLKREEQQNK
jgi:hypothetical protein